MSAEISFEEYKNMVVEKARNLLEGCTWFRGVCTDSIRASFEQGYSVEKAAEIAEMDTEFWDSI